MRCFHAYGVPLRPNSPALCIFGSIRPLLSHTHSSNRDVRRFFEAQAQELGPEALPDVPSDPHDPSSNSTTIITLELQNDGATNRTHAGCCQRAFQSFANIDREMHAIHVHSPHRATSSETSCDMPLPSPAPAIGTAEDLQDG